MARSIHRLVLLLALLPFLIAQDYGSGNPMVLVALSAAVVTKQVIASGSRDTPSTSVTEYVGIGGAQTNTWSTDEASRREVVPASGVFSDFYVECRLDIGPPGDDATFTVMKDGVATSLACSIAGSGGTQDNCNDTVNTATFAAGEGITIRWVIDDASPRCDQAGFGIVFTPDTPNYNVVLAATSASSLPASSTVYSSLGPRVDLETTELNSTTMLPLSGTVRDLYVTSNGTISAGTAIFTFRKEATTNGVTCTLDSSNATCNDLSTTTSMTAGDTWTMRIVTSGFTTGIEVSYGFVIEADIAGEFPLMFAGDNALNTTTTEINIAWGSAVNWETFPLPGPSPANFTVRAIRAQLNTAVTDGDYRFELQADEADISPAVQCTITDTNTSCSTTGLSSSVSAAEALQFETTPENTPTNTPFVTIGVLGFIAP